MTAEKRAVVWDEDNLAANQKYFEEHPVTMKIDEPPTPFAYGTGDEDDEEQIKDSPITEQEADTGEAGAHRGTTWDPKYNAVARQAKLTVPAVHAKSEVSDEQPSKKNRPKLALVDEAEATAVEEERKKEEFKHMRKQVYADEGKNFKALLSAASVDDQEDEEEEDASL